MDIGPAGHNIAGFFRMIYGPEVFSAPTIFNTIQKTNME
jgi:hypothetical protein